MPPPEPRSLRVPRVCGIEGCATDALLEVEGLVDGDLWVPICRFCALDFIRRYGVGDAVRFHNQPAPIERRVEMRLKESFVETLAKAVAAEIDTDEIEEKVIEKLIEDTEGDIRTQDVEEKVVEAVVEEINTSDVEDKAFAKIVKDILDDIQENDEFLDKIVQAVAQKVLALISKTVEEQEEEQEEERERISPPRVETAEDTTGGPGAVACRDCGGSLFLHRDETCPTYKREEIPY